MRWWCKEEGDEDRGARWGQGSHEYELVGVSPGTSPLLLRLQTRHNYYKVPSPPSHQPLPTIPLSVAPPTGRHVGVAKEGEEEGVYDNIIDTWHVTTINVVSLHRIYSVWLVRIQWKALKRKTLGASGACQRCSMHWKYRTRVRSSKSARANV